MQIFYNKTKCILSFVFVLVFKQGLTVWPRLTLPPQPPKYSDYRLCHSSPTPYTHADLLTLLTAQGLCKM